VKIWYSLIQYACLCIKIPRVVFIYGRTLRTQGLVCVRKAKSLRPYAQGLGPPRGGEGTGTPQVRLRLMNLAPELMRTPPRKLAEVVQRTTAKADDVHICGCATRAQGDVNTSSISLSPQPQIPTQLFSASILPPNSHRSKRVLTYTRTHAQRIACTRDMYRKHTALHAHPLRPGNGDGGEGEGEDGGRLPHYALF